MAWRALQVAFRQKFTGRYSDQIDEIALALRCSSEHDEFGPTGISHVRRDHKRRSIGADVNLASEDWKGRSAEDILRTLIGLTEMAFRACISQLQKQAIEFDETRFFADWRALLANLELITSPMDHTS